MAKGISTSAGLEPEGNGLHSNVARFLEQLRSWRDGDAEEHRRTWEQLLEVLKEDGRAGDAS